MDKISDTILKFLRLDGIVQHLTGFVEARVELMKAEIREDVAKTIARAMVTGVLALIGLMILLFLSVGLAHYLNSWFEQPYSGYWAVAGFYVITFLLLIVFKDNILRYFERQLSELIKRKAK